MERRNFIKIGVFTSLATGQMISCTSSQKQGDEIPLLVAGTTPAGIMAAIAAARSGVEVTLIEYQNHIGGMSTSGLGKSDVENKSAIAGLFKEFTEYVHQYYIDKYGVGSENEIRCKKGYYYEPGVAENIFMKMIKTEDKIKLILNQQIEKVTVTNGKATEAFFKDRSNQQVKSFKSRLFIDATYEGDLYALAGAEYFLGRESKQKFREEHAGRIFFDYDEKIILPGSTGEADDKLPAYTYRLCLTDDPANSYVLKEMPLGYDRNNYIKYFDDLKEGRLGPPKEYREGHGYYAAHFNTMVRIFSFAEIPNKKYDVNINPRPLGFPFGGENTDYVNASWEQREKVCQRHKELVLGMIYFIQNDTEIPEEQRRLAMQYHLPLDEFKDNEHFPWQLYVREARRLKGKYLLTENDVRVSEGKERTKIFEDSIIAGEFPIDSFPVSKEPSPNRKVLEGYVGLFPVSPYQIPFKILLPEKIEGIIVPLAVSTTHIAYSTVRMEPLWMSLGQVAGTAASLALQQKKDISKLQIEELQIKLLQNDQILTYFKDLEPGDKAFNAIQFWGTKGFFNNYNAAPRQPIQGTQLSAWVELFYQLAGRKTSKEISKINEEQITFDKFSKLIKDIASEMNISLVLEPKQWRYNPDIEEDVTRGEACLAFFELFKGIRK